MSVSGNRNQAKLNPWDVADMRKWVRTEGLGLNVKDQVHALEALYPGVGTSTIRDIVRNETWTDPTYDRTAPWPEEPEAQRSIFLWLVLWVWLHRHSATSLDFMPLLPGVCHDTRS